MLPLLFRSSIMANSSIMNNSLSNVCLPGVVLKSALISNKLSVCCINAQSICARKMSKFDELHQIVLTSNVDIVCIVESWLNAKVSDNIACIDGYNLVRHDRVHKQGGGILIYIKNKINHKIVDVSCNVIGVDNTEYVFLELSIARSKLLMGAFYNPPNLSCSELILDKISTIGVVYDDIIMLGDFNTNLLNCSLRKVNDFISVVDSLGLINA